jgi:hypothetical protein
MNEQSEIVAVSAAWISVNYAFNFYYFSIEKHNFRWMVTEKLIQYAFGEGVLVFHTDNLMDTSVGSYEFQKALGYKTVRLRFK